MEGLLDRHRAPVFLLVSRGGARASHLHANHVAQLVGIVMVDTPRLSSLALLEVEVDRQVFADSRHPMVLVLKEEHSHSHSSLANSFQNVAQHMNATPKVAVNMKLLLLDVP